MLPQPSTDNFSELHHTHCPDGSFHFGEHLLVGSFLNLYLVGLSVASTVQQACGVIISIHDLVTLAVVLYGRMSRVYGWVNRSNSRVIFISDHVSFP